jgi:hypothetical protein
MMRFMIGRPTPFTEDSLAPLDARVISAPLGWKRPVTGPCRPHSYAVFNAPVRDAP